MNKSELIQKLYTRFPKLEYRKAHAIVNLIIDKMAQTLLDGERIEIRGFGTFSLKHHAPRLAQNPKTGQKLIAKEKYSVRFKPGQEIADALNKTRSKDRDY